MVNSTSIFILSSSIFPSTTKSSTIGSSGKTSMATLWFIATSVPSDIIMVSNVKLLIPAISGACTTVEYLSDLENKLLVNFLVALYSLPLTITFSTYI